MPIRLLCALALLLVLGGWSFAAQAEQCTPEELSTLAATDTDGDAEAAEVAEVAEIAEAPDTDTDTEQDGEWHTYTTCKNQGCAQSGTNAAALIALGVVGGLWTLRRQKAKARQD